MRHLPRKLTAEFLGTALLLFAVVGSGIATEQLGTDGAAQLLAHALTVGLALGALITFLSPVSGAHFNPSVTLGVWRMGGIPAGLGVAYVSVQVLGALAGVVLANLTFGEPALEAASTARRGAGVVGSELVVTFVLVLLILGLVRSERLGAVAPTVAAWVAAGIFGSASTGFANPAVTLARMGTDTYTGIEPGSVPAFLAAQLIAGVAAALAAVFLFPVEPDRGEGAAA